MTTPHASKIAALLATAESFAAEGNEQAAASYMQKAMELQLRHQLSDEDIRSAGSDHAPSDQLVTKIVIGVAKGSAYVKAKRDLVTGVGQIFNVRVALYSDRSGMLFYGFESDVTFVQTLVSSIIIQLESAVAQTGGDRSFKTSFAHGYVYRVLRRLREAHTATRVTVEADRPGTDIVLRDRATAVAEYVDVQLGGGRRGPVYTNRSIRDGAGLAAGDRAGMTADLGQTRVTGGRKAIGGFRSTDGTTSTAYRG